MADKQDGDLCTLCLQIKAEVSCEECRIDRCQSCDKLYHKAAERSKHKRNLLKTTQPVPCQNDARCTDSNASFVHPVSAAATNKYQWQKAQSENAREFSMSSVSQLPVNPNNFAVSRAAVNVPSFQPRAGVPITGNIGWNKARTNPPFGANMPASSVDTFQTLAYTATHVGPRVPGASSMSPNYSNAAIPNRFPNPQMIGSQGLPQFPFSGVNLGGYHSNLVNSNTSGATQDFTFMFQQAGGGDRRNTVSSDATLGNPSWLEDLEKSIDMGAPKPLDINALTNSMHQQNMMGSSCYEMPSFESSHVPIPSVSTGFDRQSKRCQSMMVPNVPRDNSLTPAVPKINFCPSCGSRFAGGKFCSNCGFQVVGQSLAPPVMQQAGSLNSSESFFTPPASPDSFLKSELTTRSPKHSPRKKENSAPPDEDKLSKEPEVPKVDTKEAAKTTEKPKNDEPVIITRRGAFEDDDSTLIDGMETVSFLKDQIAQGSSLDDLEVMLASSNPTIQGVDICTSAVEDTMNAVNDIVASKLNQELKKVLCLSVAERRSALELCEFDSIKAAEFSLNSRKCLGQQLIGVGAENKKYVLFHEKMQQNGGNYRSAYAEMQGHIFANLLQSRIWNSDEGSNILERQDSAKSESFSAEAMTYTDTLVEDAVRNSNIPPVSGILAKAVFLRKIMAEKQLPFSRAQLLFSMLKNKPDLEYSSALWIAKNISQESLKVPKSYERYIVECSVQYEELAHCFIIKLPSCKNECKVCHNCMRKHLQTQLYESGKSVRNIECPGCGSKIISNNENDTYLQQQLKNFLPQEMFKLFDTRFLENILEEDNYFKWCSEATCAQGILWENPRVLKMTCYEGHSTCFECGRKWVDQHDGLTCEQFSQWEMENDPEYQSKRLDGFLRAIDAMKCPQCKFRYELVRGGCLHFTCSKCQTEFCGFCYALYSKECRRFSKCAKLGLHQHCPRSVSLT